MNQRRLPRTGRIAGIVTGAALVCAIGWAGAGTAAATTRPRPAGSAAPDSPAACYAFAIAALRQHVVVRHTPAACAGLPPDQVNVAVGRAIRTVVGPLPKAAARRRAVAAGRYLARLIRPALPPRPASLATNATARASSLPPHLAALAVWLAAAVAGGYLLAGRLTRDSRRRVRVQGAPWWLAGGHAGLAGLGLCLWIAFVLTAEPVIGWIDVVLTWVIVGLGMATLLADAPASARETVTAHAGALGVTAAQPAAGVPVVTIALHGVLATATVVLVLLAVIGAG